LGRITAEAFELVEVAVSLDADVPESVAASEDGAATAVDALSAVLVAVDS
jgi:hypothetical protein